MDNMEFNKIFAAILVAGIVASLSGFVSKKLVHPHELKENAVKIEGADEPAAGGVKKEKLPEPILAMIAGADIARGEKISKACAACHSFDKGGANGVGPNMYGLVGREKQVVPGYSYSGALNERGGDYWTYSELNKFLWKPKWHSPKTKMNYLGIKKPEDRAAIIAWMNTLSDSPLGPPSEAEIATELAELAPPEEESAEEETEDSAAGSDAESGEESGEAETEEGVE